MVFKYDEKNVEHAHMRIDIIEDKNIKQDERHDTTEETVKTLLETLVSNDQRKENDHKWYKRIAVSLLIAFIVVKVGVVEAVKIWLGLI